MRQSASDLMGCFDAGNDISCVITNHQPILSLLVKVDSRLFLAIYVRITETVGLGYIHSYSIFCNRILSVGIFRNEFFSFDRIVRHEEKQQICEKLALETFCPMFRSYELRLYP